jgi:hypothetical protein
MNQPHTPQAADVDRAYGLEPILETGVDQRFSPVMQFATVPCPHCGGTYESSIDLTLGAQEYIEDCQVCCRSIELGIDVVNGVLKGLTAKRIDET